MVRKGKGLGRGEGVMRRGGEGVEMRGKRWRGGG